MAKVALLTYHSKLHEIYPQEWIDKYVETVRGQTLKDFGILEMNYGGGDERVFEDSYFESYKYPTFVHALNYLLDKAFGSGYDIVFNSNVDDWMRHDWMERLILDVNKGYDLVSSNFCLVKEGRITTYHRFHHLNILHELERNHNPVCHPAVAYTKKFWATNRYRPEEIPEEDLLLWKRALQSGSKFFINEQNLLFHRIHLNAVCQSNNR